MSRCPIVFDLDGTLIDSVPDIHAAVVRMLLSHGLTPLSVAEVASFVGNGIHVLIDRVAGAVGVTDRTLKANMLDRFQSEYQRHPTERTTTYLGAIEALTDLASAGHLLGICTNKPHAITRSILANLGLADFFGVVIAGDSLSIRKPDPRPLVAAFDALERGRGLFVGDSEIDAQTAQAAGIRFLLFTQGYRKSAVCDIAHYRSFSALDQLPALVKYSAL